MKFNVQKLIRARLLKRWSRTQLAAKSGLSTSMVSKIETGERNSEKSIFKMSKALGVPMEDLIEEGSDAA